MENKQLSPGQKTIVGVQFLFVAFGATVLVPMSVFFNKSGLIQLEMSNNETYTINN